MQAAIRRAANAPVVNSCEIVLAAPLELEAAAELAAVAAAEPLALAMEVIEAVCMADALEWARASAVALRVPACC